MKNIHICFLKNLSQLKSLSQGIHSVCKQQYILINSPCCIYSRSFFLSCPFPCKIVSSSLSILVWSYQIPILNAGSYILNAMILQFGHPHYITSKTFCMLPSNLSCLHFLTSGGVTLWLNVQQCFYHVSMLNKIKNNKIIFK